MKLAEVYYEIVVDVSPQKAWEVLASYGNVGDFHAGLKSSRALNGSSVAAKMGADRECTIPNGRKDIIVREKITNFEDGKSYTYDVYDWVNFPLRRMRNTFGVKVGGGGKTVLYQRTQFRLKPGFLTVILKGKLRGAARDGLIAYKHFMETGEPNVDMKSLKKKFRSV